MIHETGKSLKLGSMNTSKVSDIYACMLQAYVTTLTTGLSAMETWLLKFSVL